MYVSRNEVNMRIWSQNIKKDDIEHLGKSNAWMHRRGTISNADLDRNKQATREFGWEVHSAPQFRFGIRFSASKMYVSEHTLSGHISIPIFSFYWNINSTWLENKKWYSRLLKEDSTKVDRPWGEGMKNHAEEYEICFNIHDWSISWKLWKPEGIWESSWPKWRDGSIELRDSLLGGVAVKERVLREEKVLVIMPEKTYDAEVKIIDHIRKRKRWPFENHILRGEISCEEGIPHPGKGTCGWNCGDDRTYSVSSPVSSLRRGVSEMMGEMVSSVEYCRKNYPL